MLIILPTKFYGKTKSIEELEALDQREENGRRYHKSSFRYDEVRDTYICLEGNELEHWGEYKREGKPSLILYQGESCRECAVRE
jgi:hypothetical protein